MDNKMTNTITIGDVKEWAVQTFVFSIPAIVAVLGALSGTLDWKIATGAGLSALSTSLMNLYGKYKTGV